ERPARSGRGQAFRGNDSTILHCPLRRRGMKDSFLLHSIDRNSPSFMSIFFRQCLQHVDKSEKLFNSAGVSNYARTPRKRQPSLLLPKKSTHECASGLTTGSFWLHCSFGLLILS